MPEPLLFSDSEGESDVDSDGDDFMADRQNYGEGLHSIPWPRLNKIADEIYAFYDRDDSLEHERGTQLDRLFEHLKGEPIKLAPEEITSPYFWMLLREQPDGLPPVPDDDLPPDKQAFQEHLEKEKEKIINRLKEKRYLLTEERSETYNSDKSYDWETGSEAESETGSDFETNLNLSDNQRSPLKTYERFPLSQNNMLEDQKENYYDFDSEDFDMDLLTAPKTGVKNRGYELEGWSTLISQRPRANFIATPLGWSLLEIPSCS